MRFLIFIFILLFTLPTDLDARKRKRKRPQTPKAKEYKMLPEEKAKFEEVLVYKKSYQKIYQLGAYLYILREESLPDEDNKTQHTEFFGTGLIGRFDYSEKITFFPKLTYTVFDHNKVLPDHTSSLNFGFFEPDITYRFQVNKTIEIFLGGGPHLFYRKFNVNYPEQATTTEKKISETDFKFGVGATALSFLKINNVFSFFISARLYGINPDTTAALIGGAVFNIF